MTLTLLAYICLALAGTVAMLAAWRLPVRPGCPECGASTVAVVAPRWIRWLGLPVDARWCLSCGWEGFSRRGAGAHRPNGSVPGLRRDADPPASRNGSGGAAWRRPDRRPTGRPDPSDAPPDGERSGSMDAGEQD